MTRQPSGLLVIAPEVQRALTRSEPVVGLESSLIAHNLPATVGPDVARECEQRVRAAGAVPATIAVIDGQIHVGIDSAQIERLAVEPQVRKVGPRDLGAVDRLGHVWRDHRRRNDGGVPGCRDALHGDSRHRRRPSRLGDVG